MQKILTAIIALALSAVSAQAVTTINRITILSDGSWQASHSQVYSVGDRSIFYPPWNGPAVVTAQYTHKAITGTGPALGTTTPNYTGTTSGGTGGVRLLGATSTSPEPGYTITVTNVGTSPATVNRTFFRDAWTCGTIFYSTNSRTGLWRMDADRTYPCPYPAPVPSGGTSAGSNRWKPLWLVEKTDTSIMPKLRALMFATFIK